MSEENTKPKAFLAKSRFIEVPNSASALIIQPGEGGVGFEVRVDTAVPPDQITNNENQTGPKLCAVAAYTAGDWLFNGHPSDREDTPKLYVPGGRR